MFYGIHLPSAPGKWITLTWLILLGTTSSTALGVAFSVIPRSGRSASAVVSPIVIVLQFFSGVFFVYTQLPKGMQLVAAVFPLKWLTQGMRSVFLPNSFAAHEVAHSWETGRLIVGLFLSIRTFKWERS
jgi:ABC-2 type transport system permease protein